MRTLLCSLFLAGRELIEGLKGPAEPSPLVSCVMFVWKTWRSLR